MPTHLPLQLQTSRFVLRQLRAGDAPAIHAYRCRPDVARYQSWDENYSLDDAEALVAEQENLAPDMPGKWLQLAIVEVNSGLLMGDCGLHFRADEPQQVELGITLSPPFKGIGAARESLECVLQWLFASQNKHRVTAICDADNHAAARLFERLGFRPEAHSVEAVWFKGAWGSEVHFALLQREFFRGSPQSVP